MNGTEWYSIFFPSGDVDHSGVVWLLRVVARQARCQLGVSCREHISSILLIS